MSSISSPITQLSPVTQRKFKALVSRRDFLLGTRGICITVCVAIVTLLLAVAVDYFWLMEGTQRWILSSVFYGVSIVACVTAVIIPLRNRLSSGGIARLAEHREPSLREKVLPAVELSLHDTNGSAAFRQQVALAADQAMAPISISNLLPLALIGRWIGAASLALLALCSMLALPGSNIPAHIARVLLPAADFGRPSATQIEIISPLVGDQIVAPGELVSFEIRIDRPERWSEQPVHLELKQPTGETSLIDLGTAQPVSKEAFPNPETDRMSGRRSQSFRANLALEQTVQYRFLADGAITPWASISVVPRPEVSQFRYRLKYPEYANVLDLEHAAELGDISTVSGTQLTLIVEADQPLAEAYLQWRDATSAAAEPHEMSLQKETPTTWIMKTELNDSAQYRFKGKAQRSQLESVLGENQRINVATDQAPLLRWLEPQKSQQTISAQALLDLKILITDEFPLAKLELLARVDRQYWQSVQAIDPPEFAMDSQTIRHEQEVDCSFDLLDRQLTKGQMLELKCVATDRNGQQSDSPILTYIISSQQLNALIRPWLQRRIQLAEKVRDTVAAIQDQDLKETIEKWRSEADPNSKATLIEELLQFAQLNQRRSTQMLVALQQELERASNPAIANEYERTIEYLQQSSSIDSQITREAIRQAEAQTDENLSRQDLEKAVQMAQTTQQQQKDLADRFTKQVEHDVLDDLGQNFHSAIRFANEIKTNSEAGTETWRRQYELLGSHMRSVAGKLLSQKTAVAADRQNSLDDWARWSAEQADRIDILTDPESNLEQIEQQQTNLINEFGYHQGITQIAGSSIQESLQTQQLWQRLSGTPSQKLAELTDSLAVAFDQNQQTSALPAETIDLLQGKLDRLSERRSNQYLRESFDGQHAADLGMAKRAAQKLLNDAKTTTESSEKQRIRERLQQVTNAMRRLEIANHLEQTQVFLSELKRRERFEPDAFATRNESPRQFETMSEQLNQANELAGPAQLSDELRNALSQLRWSEELSRSGNIISPRRWDANSKNSAVAALDDFQKRLDLVEQQLEETFAAARETLASAGPTISQLAQNAANEAEAQQFSAEAMAKEQREGNIPNLEQRLQQQYEKQFSPQSAQSQLSEALRDTASAQDLLEQEERELAKDADVGRAMVERSQQLIATSMAEATQTEETQTAEALEQVAHTEEQTKVAMQAIADHFAKLENEEKLSEADKIALAAAAEQILPNVNDQLDERYENAEALEALSRQDRDEMLKQLEAELKRSEEMQGQLSEISQSIAEQAKDGLQQAAETEQRLQDENENSDDQFKFQKEQLKRELDELANQSLDIANRVHHNVTDSARRLKQNSEAEELQQAAHQLYEAANQARQTNAQQPLSELEAAANRLSEAAKKLTPPVENLKEQATLQKSEVPHEDENQWRRAQQEAQRIQDQIRQDDIRKAENRQRQTENQLRSDERRQNQAQKELENAERRVEEARRQWEKHDNAQWAKDQLTQQEIRLADAQSAKDLANQTVQRQKQREADSQANTETTRSRELPSLEGKNPIAEMAESLAERVQKQTEAIAESAEKLTRQSQQEQLQSNRQQLQSAASQQQQLGQAVQQIAADLQRAAAHENRLNQEQNSQQLEQIANQVNETQQSKLTPTEQAMQDAAQSNDPTNDRNANAQQSAAIQNQLQDSENALQQHAEQLQQAIADHSAAKRDSQSKNSLDRSANQSPANSPTQAKTNSPQNSDSGSSQQSHVSQNQASQNQANANQALQSMSATEKAQMLDQLSQAATPRDQSQSQSSQAQASMSQASQAQPVSNQLPAQLSAAAKRLAAQMNQQRQSSSSNKQSWQQAMSQHPPSRQSQSMQVEGDAGQAPAASSVLLDQRELDGDWSQLRQQTAEEVIETKREIVAPRYRQQIENYFKILSQQQK